MIQRFEQAMLREGSTRSVSLLRILLAMIAWVRWSDELLPWRDMHVERLMLCAAFLTITLMMFLGVLSRLSTLLTGLLTNAMVYVIDPSVWHSHHTRALALAILLLALTPCGGSWSVDRWFALRRAERNGTPPPLEIGPTWGRLAIGLMVGAVYFWSGMDKFTWGFLSGERLQHMWMYAYLGSDYPQTPLFPMLAMAGGVFTTALWCTMPVALFHPRLQKVFLPIGLVMHAVIWVTMPVGVFSVTMWATYLVYLDPDAFHRFVDRMNGVPPSPSSEAETQSVGS